MSKWHNLALALNWPMGSENISGLTLPLTSNSTCKTSGFLSIHPLPKMHGRCWEVDKMGGCKTFFLNSNIILTIYLSESDLFNGDFFFRFQEDNNKNRWKSVELQLRRAWVWSVWFGSQLICIYGWHDYPYYISIRCRIIR